MSTVVEGTIPIARCFYLRGGGGLTAIRATAQADRMEPVLPPKVKVRGAIILVHKQGVSAGGADVSEARWVRGGTDWGFKRC